MGRSQRPFEFEAVLPFCSKPDPIRFEVAVKTPITICSPFGWNLGLPFSSRAGLIWFEVTPPVWNNMVKPLQTQTVSDSDSNLAPRFKPNGIRFWTNW